MKRLLIVPTLLTLMCFGCAGGAYHVHPGAGGYVSGTATAAQTFDSQEYDALVAANSVIQNVQVDYLGGKFPASALPTIKTAVNAAATAYNTAQAQWLAFDEELKNGGSPSQAALVSAISVMNTTIARLVVAKGAK